MWTTLTSNTNQNMSCVSIQGLHPSKNENSGEFTIYVTSSPRPCRAPRKVTRLWSQSRRILVFLSSHSALLGSISTAVCMFFITSLDPTFASWSAAPVAWQLWQYLGPLFFKWLYIWKVHPAAITFRVSIVVVFCKKQIQPSSVHNDSWQLCAAKDAAVGFFRARETKAAFLRRIWSRIWNETASNAAFIGCSTWIETYWCRPSTALHGNSAPWWQRPPQQDNTSHKLLTAHEKPQKHNKEVKASTWPPQIPNQSSNSGTSQNRSNPWGPHCGPT